MPHHLHDELHHTELHRAMLAAADNYSMATYHAHIFTQEELPAKRKVEADA
jgi:hypothetical protein